MTSQAEIVFRREWGRAVAVVTRLTGDLGLAEDAVQEAFAAAIGHWATGPLPSDPSGWLITDARRDARATADGRLVLLEEQDRGRWDRAKIDEGTQILDRAMRRPGPYQLQAAIAACHAAAEHPGATDWAEIAALYAALARGEPSPVVHANRAVAVAMAEGPAAGLAILDELRDDSRCQRWHLLHACRADLLRRLGRTAEAGDAYRIALALDPPPAEREFLAGRLAEIDR